MVSNTNLYEKTRYDKGCSHQLMLKISKDPFPTSKLMAKRIPFIQKTELLFSFPVTVLLFQNWCRRKKVLIFHEPEVALTSGMGERIQSSLQSQRN